MVYLNVRHAHRDPADTLRPARRRDPADEYTAKIRGRHTDSSVGGGYPLATVCLIWFGLQYEYYS